MPPPKKKPKRRDLLHLAYVKYAETLGVDVETYRHVAAFFRELKSFATKLTANAGIATQAIVSKQSSPLFRVDTGAVSTMVDELLFEMQFPVKLMDALFGGKEELGGPILVCDEGDDVDEKVTAIVTMISKSVGITERIPLCTIDSWQNMCPTTFNPSSYGALRKMAAEAARNAGRAQLVKTFTGIKAIDDAETDEVKQKAGFVLEEGGSGDRYTDE